MRNPFCQADATLSTIAAFKGLRGLSRPRGLWLAMQGRRGFVRPAPGSSRVWAALVVARTTLCHFGYGGG
jgi:hypothetical protein